MTFSSFIKSETTEIFVFLPSIVTNLVMRIRFRVKYKNFVIFFLHMSLALSFTVTPGFYSTFWCKRKAKKCLDLPLTANKVRTFRNYQLCVSFNLRWVHTSGVCLNICVMPVDDGR